VRRRRGRAPVRCGPAARRSTAHGLLVPCRLLQLSPLPPCSDSPSHIRTTQRHTHCPCPIPYSSCSAFHVDGRRRRRARRARRRGGLCDRTTRDPSVSSASGMAKSMRGGMRRGARKKTAGSESTSREVSRIPRCTIGCGGERTFAVAVGTVDLRSPRRCRRVSAVRHIFFFLFCFLQQDGSIETLDAFRPVSLETQHASIERTEKKWWLGTVDAGSNNADLKSDVDHLSVDLCVSVYYAFHVDGRRRRRARRARRRGRLCDRTTRDPSVSSASGMAKSMRGGMRRGARKKTAGSESTSREVSRILRCTIGCGGERTFAVAVGTVDLRSPRRCRRVSAVRHIFFSFLFPPAGRIYRNTRRF
jgi:hypothetical protein